MFVKCSLASLYLFIWAAPHLRVYIYSHVYFYIAASQAFIYLFPGERERKCLRRYMCN